jgi:hypothetical protein
MPFPRVRGVRAAEAALIEFGIIYSLPRKHRPYHGVCANAPVKQRAEQTASTETVWAENAPDGGAVFPFTIPKA